LTGACHCYQIKIAKSSSSCCIYFGPEHSTAADSQVMTVVGCDILIFIFQIVYTVSFKHWFVTRYTTKITARLLDGFQDIAISWYQKVKPFWVLLQQEMMKTASVTIRTLKHMQSLHLAAVVSPWSHTNSFFYRPDNIPETNQQCQSKLLLIYNKIYAKI